MGQIDIDQLVEKYSRRLFNLAYRITGNRTDAEDIVQETFMQVYENLDSFRNESGIYTWIYKIAVNNCLRLKKANQSRFIESYEEAVLLHKDNVPPEVTDWFSDPEKACLMNELLDEIRQGCRYLVLFRLPDSQRIVYVMRIMFDFSYNEISEILGISENVIKARLNRARDILQEYFEKRCKWYCQGSDECCKAKVGYALTLDTELLKRVTAKACEQKPIQVPSHEDSRDVDEIFKSLRHVNFDPSNLRKLFISA